MIWAEHIENRSAFPPDELLKFEGQHVAWGLDGKQILASDHDPSRLIDRLDEAGYGSDQYVLSFVDSGSCIGGVANKDRLQYAYREVTSWPAEERLALATHLLQSLHQEEESATVPRERQEALQQLIGIWKTEHPPNDEQVEQMIDQALIKKYG